ncbi:MAG: hypothetical protein ACO4AY_08840 [Ilumatobacteraceae bacterium]
MNTENTPSNDESTAGTAAPGRGRRRGLVIGGAAGLVGGGLVGLAMTLPSITNAASEISDVVPIVAELDDPVDGPVAGGAMHRAGAQHGVRRREALPALVDDGTITAEQADAVADHLVANAPRRGHEGRGGPGRRGGPGFDGEVVAEVLGIDVATFREAVKSGQSIAEIAEANGVDVQAVIDVLVAEAQAHLDLAVESGRLTEDEAAAKAAELTERITARVDGEFPPHR